MRYLSMVSTQMLQRISLLVFKYTESQGIPQKPFNGSAKSQLNIHNVFEPSTNIYITCVPSVLCTSCIGVSMHLILGLILLSTSLQKQNQEAANLNIGHLSAL